MSAANLIPAEIWARFEHAKFDPETECFVAPDGSLVDFKNNRVVLADGRTWNDVRIFGRENRL